MSEELDAIINRITLPDRLAIQGTEKAGIIIDQLLEEDMPQNGLADESFLRTAKVTIEKSLQGAYSLTKAGVLVPVGLWGLNQGLTAPDLDIKLLGIGKHRFFLFHSSLGLVVLRHFYRTWQQGQAEDANWFSRVKLRITGTALGTMAMGVGVHLLIDVFQPKAVIFPFFGSLVRGTLVDDNIWLLGNSLWAFKISHDIFALVMGDELASAKEFVRNSFGETGFTAAMLSEVTP